MESPEAGNVENHQGCQEHGGTTGWLSCQLVKKRNGQMESQHLCLSSSVIQGEEARGVPSKVKNPKRDLELEFKRKDCGLMGTLKGGNWVAAAGLAAHKTEGNPDPRERTRWE